MNDEAITEKRESTSIKMPTPEPENCEIDNHEMAAITELPKKIRKIDYHEMVAITELLEKGATWMGTAVMLMQGGIFFDSLEIKDCLLVLLIILFTSFRHRIIPIDICDWNCNPQPRDNIQQSALLGFIRKLIYWCKVVSTIVCAVLSMMQLVSQDFGQKKVENMATRNFSLNVFYVLALIETLLSLLDLILRKFFEPHKEPPKETPKEPPKEAPKLPPKAPPPEYVMKEKFTILDQMNTDGQHKDQSDNFGVTRINFSLKDAKCAGAFIYIKILDTHNKLNNNVLSHILSVMIAFR